MIPCRYSAPRHTGFTLIELLVVVVVMGMMITVTLLAIDDPAQAELERAMRRIQQTMRLAHEEAELNRVELAIKFSRDGYRFERLEQNQNQNQSQNQNQNQNSNKTPGNPQTPGSTKTQNTKWKLVNKPRFMQSHKLEDGYELTLMHNGVSVSLDEKDAGRILLASSGEMTPFELYLRVPSANLSLHLVGNAFGELRIPELDGEAESLQK